MIRLIKGNVERLAVTEEQAKKLEVKGFKRAAENQAKKFEMAVDKPLEEMTVKELRTLAKEKGIDVPTSLGKEDLVKILDGDGDGNQ